MPRPLTPVSLSLITIETSRKVQAHWQLGEKEKAREWYDKAVQWMDNNQPANDELRRFRSEAAELLGIKDVRK